MSCSLLFLSCVNLWQIRVLATGQAVKTGQTNYAHSRPIRNADKDENWRNGRSIQQKNARNN